MQGNHDPTLVVLSILIAIAASYTALDLASRIRAAATRSSMAAWLSTASLAMGGGIWSMHFVAMLAFSMPGMDVSYDIGLTVISLALAVFVTGIGFAVVSRAGHGFPALALSGLFMGLGIAGMHYTGMAAMRMPASLSYDASWLAISIFIAIAASIVALWLAFRKTGAPQKAIASVLMGFAVSGMHFSGMRAAIYSSHLPMQHGVEETGFSQLGLALAVAGTTFFILALSLVASIFDRRFAILAEKEGLALRRSEEQFRSLYRRTPLPLHSLDRGGKLTEVSDAWLHLLGRNREDVIGRDLPTFMTQESGDRWDRDWPMLLSVGHLLDAEYQLIGVSRNVIDVIASSRLERDAQGSFVSVLGGLVDVTARKKVEEALRQSQKLEALGQLTGGVAHDFNNLLAAILGSLELLGKRIPDDPKSQRMLNTALEGAKRGAILTQRMLSFARQQALNPEPVDVPELVRGMEELLQRSLGPLVQIDARFARGSLMALVDAHQLELALLNLAVNARDAMHDVGTLSIKAGKRQIADGEIASFAAGKCIFLSVQDTGEGMDDATLIRSTEPFFTTKGVSKGTGLGLSMVHGFAQQSGGTLTLTSRPGEGTTAEILLPIAETGSVGTALAIDDAAASKSTRPLSVLAVDDDALVLMNTVDMLEELGHTVVSAISGTKAIDVFRQHPDIDLILTDQAMPGMSGVEFAASVRGKNPKMPIILATGYADIPGKSELNLLLLNKPFSGDQLNAVIERAMSTR